MDRLRNPSYSYSFNEPDSTAPMQIIARHVGNRHVIVVGSSHREVDPNHPKYQAGMRLIEGWRDATNGHPDHRILRYEGRYSGKGKTPEESITNHFGESALIKWFADEFGIPAASSEPTLSEEIRTATSHYSYLAEQKAYFTSAFLAGRELPWVGQAQHSNIYIESQISRYTRVAPSVTYEKFNNYFKQRYGFDYTYKAFAQNPNTNEIIDNFLELTETTQFENLTLSDLAPTAKTIQGTRSVNHGRVVARAALWGGKSILSWTGRRHLKEMEPAFTRLGEPCEASSFNFSECLDHDGPDLPDLHSYRIAIGVGSLLHVLLFNSDILTADDQSAIQS